MKPRTKRMIVTEEQTQKGILLNSFCLIACPIVIYC
jgi:hypothetical protein